MVCPHSAWVSAAGSAQGRLSVPRRSAPRALPLLPIPTPVPLASRMLSFPGAGSSLIWPPSSSFLQVGHSHLSGRPSQTPTKFLSSPPLGLKRWCALFNPHLHPSRQFRGFPGGPWRGIHLQCRDVGSVPGRRTKTPTPRGVSAFLPQLLSP